MPSRNIQAINLFFYTASAGFWRKYLYSGDKEHENELYEKTIVMYPLYSAYCGYGTLYNGL